MKHSKKLNFIGILTLGASLVIPMVSLTSCSKVSQWYLPVITGGSTGPFSSLPTDKKDINNNNIDEYVPKSFDYYVNPAATSSQNSAVSYVYCCPDDLTNIDDDQTSPFTPSKFDTQWINTNDSQKFITGYSLKDTELDPDGKHKRQYVDARNLNLYTMSNATNMISNTVSAFYNYMMNYQLRLVNKYIVNNDRTYLDQIYGGNFNFGSKDANDNQFTSFMEYNFALANLFAEPKSTIKFAQSGFNFLYNSSITDKSFGFLTTCEDINAMLSTEYPYAKTDDPEDEEEKKVIGYYSIPVVFTPTDMTYSFYNPLTSNKSFLPNDWLITDKSIVDNKVATSDAWKNFRKITGATQTQGLDWEVKYTGKDITFDDSSKICKEPTLARIWGTGKKVKSNSWIAMCNYTVYTINQYNMEDPDHPTEERYPVFTGVNTLFPSFLLVSSDADQYFEQKTEDDESVYFINQTAVDKKMKAIISSLNSHDITPSENTEIFNNFFDTNSSNIFKVS